VAQFPIDIKIDTTDQNKLGPLNRQLNETDRAATAASTATRSLSVAIGAVASAASVGQLIRLADSYTKIQNSIINVVSGTEELTQRTGDLLRIANQTRSSFESTAGLYGKLKRATDDLGLSQDRVLRITDLINKGFIASGATTTEASNAIIQLAQGLASGALRGDEFNSVAEQAPVILRAVAQETGKTIGELREFAATGGITADILIRSIEGYADTVDREFARTAKTFDQQATVARNLATDYVGNSEAIQAASQAAGATLVTLAENLDTVTDAAVALAVVYGARLVGQLASATAALVAQGVAATATKVQYDALGVAVARTTGLQTAAAVATKALGASLALLGGPVGVAILAGAALLYFGNSAEASSKKLADARLKEEVDALIVKYNELGRLGQRNLVNGLVQQQIDLAGQVAAANAAYDVQKKKAEEAGRAGAAFGLPDREPIRQLELQLDIVNKKLKALLDTRAPDPSTFKPVAEAARQTADEYTRLAEVRKGIDKLFSEGLFGETPEGFKAAQDQITSLTRQAEALKLTGVEQAVYNNTAQLAAGSTDAQRQRIEELTRAIYANGEAERDRAALADRYAEIAPIGDGTALETPAQKLQREYDEREAVLIGALSDELITFEEYKERQLNLETEYDKKRLEQRAATQSAVFTATAQGFDALAGIIEAASGKQNKAYRVAYVASRAFALADSILKVTQASAQALADPTAITLPQKFANYAAIATAGAGLLSAFKQPAGFANGGPVSGPGTGRSDSILARLSNGEFVMPANRTSQYSNELEAMRRGAFNPSASTTSAARITINNYASDLVTTTVTEGPNGDLIQTIDRRIAEQTPSIVSQQLGDPYSESTRTLNSAYRLERN
jgi:tape measure domain-containing protein